MIWELYEVWGVEKDGHEELIDTTNSLKEATALAQGSLTDQFVETIIYKETEEGELELVQTFAKE